MKQQAPVAHKAGHGCRVTGCLRHPVQQTASVYRVEVQKYISETKPQGAGQKRDGTENKKTERKKKKRAQMQLDSWKSSRSCPSGEQ